VSHRWPLRCISILCRFSRDFSCCLQEQLTRKDGQVLSDPLPSDDSVLIHEEERSLCYPSFHTWIVYLLRIASRSAGNTACGAVLNTIRLDDILFHVAEEWVRQLQRVGKCFLRKGKRIGDAEDLDIQFFEFLIIGLPGR
jgi:hypothetical protein